MDQPKVKDEPFSRLLYIEDDEDIQKIAKIALESIGKFELKMSNNGLRGIDDARTFKPQLILLDAMMPEMDGPGTIKRLKQDPDLKDIPVIFVTARVQPEERKEYTDLGAIDVIAKPFDPMNLSNQIRTIWQNLPKF